MPSGPRSPPATLLSGLQIPRKLRSAFGIRVTVVLACLCLFYLIYPWPQHRRSSLCEQFPDPGGIVIAVKTGATEPREKLLPILRTSLQCANDVIVLSDVEDTRDNLHTHDVLQYFSPEVMLHNTDFDLYRQLQSLHAARQEQALESLQDAISPLDSSSPLGKSAGWVLDKYKFLHIADAAWYLRPGRQWYLFLETDTYLSWPNFLRWLHELDHQTAYYLGNAVPKAPEGGAQYFAQGGSGIVLSGKVVEEITTRKLTTKWDARAHRWTFGDFLFADFLFQEMNLTVTNAWPAFNDFNSTTLPLTPSTWCEPMITLHRVASDAFDKLFERERSGAFTRFLRSDAYRAGVGDDFRFPDVTADWDNLSEGREHRVDIAEHLDAHASVSNCRHACETTTDCFEFLFRNTTSSDSQPMHECVLSNAFRLGHPKAAQDFGGLHEPDLARSWTSGWRSEKIQRWIDEHGCC